VNYSRLVAEIPVHAVSTLMLWDMQLFDVTMKRVNKHLLGAKALYEAQPRGIRAKIDDAIACVNEDFRTLGVTEHIVRPDC